ncbi:MAG: glycosyltransferase [Magnetococcales bacterium]|nr:glycosyltransferase [Magnetococcales bacterium]
MKFPERILLLYGYHRGTTASLLDKALRRQVAVFSMGPGHVTTETSLGCDPTTAIQEILTTLASQDPPFQPEVILVIESGVKFFPEGLEESPVPCWYYSLDAHFNLHWQVEYAKLFDAVFVSFQQYLTSFLKAGNRSVHWLPHGFDADHYRDYGTPRDVDVAFVGDMNPEKRPQRVKYLNALKEAGFQTLFTEGIWNEEVARLYSRSRLVFNDNDAQVFNPRNFEGSACGAVVLANPAISLEEFFTPGKDILIYHDSGELLRSCREVLRHPDRWQEIARQAKRTAAANSWDVRVVRLMEIVSGLLDDKQTTFSQPDRIKAHAFVYFHRGLPGQTIALLDRLQQDGFRDMEIFLMKALAYMSHDFYDAAAKELFALLELTPPPDPNYLQQIGDVLIGTFERTRHVPGAMRTAMVLSHMSFSQQQRLARIVAEARVDLPRNVAEKLGIAPSRRDAD